MHSHFYSHLGTASRLLFGTRTARRLSAFLALNLSLMLLELGYGLLSNSLSLASDGAHMLIDCVAIGIGLAGAAAARRPSDAAFNQGYGRAEALASLANGLLLLLVGTTIFVEALHRSVLVLFSEAPPEVDDASALPVAIAGLAVNGLGLVLFSDQHVHAGGGCCVDHSRGGGGGGGDKRDGGGVGGAVEGSDGGGEGGGGGGGSDASGGSHGSSDNVRAVLLHVMADACGSVGAILSSLLVRYRGWHWADPVCSLSVALLILASALVRLYV